MTGNRQEISSQALENILKAIREKGYKATTGGKTISVILSLGMFNEERVKALLIKFVCSSIDCGLDRDILLMAFGVL